jgi:uncharacterized membrane protein YgcG
MSYNIHFSNRLLAIAVLILTFSSSLLANIVIANDDIVGKLAVEKITLLGNELHQKTGVNVYLMAVEELGGKTMQAIVEENSFKIVDPYALLFLAKADHQVNILTSQGVEKMFNKDKILSPYPWSGTILPLLAVKKENADKYTAAMLNGYADIVEQIAAHHNIVLDEAVGNTNRSTMGILRLMFYGIMAWVGFKLIYRRIKHRASKS